MLQHQANCTVNCKCEGDKSLTFAFLQNKATCRTTPCQESQALSKGKETEKPGKRTRVLIWAS